MISAFLFIKKLLKFLNENETVENISFSLTMSLCFSLIPLNPIVHPLLLILLILFNGNLFIFLVVTPGLSAMAGLISQEFHSLGNFVLTHPSLLAVFQSLANVPLLIYSNWNNTITMGSIIVSLAVSVPIYYVYKRFINSYRQLILPKIKSSKLMYLFKFPNWITWFKR